MSDRVSRAPPSDFLGPDDVAEYERLFSSPTGPPRPRSSGGQPLKKVSNRFFGPLWEGVREKLRLTRSKSASSIMSNKHKDSVAQQQQRQGHSPHHHQHTSSLGAATPGLYPTKEEVMQNYKSLMDSGFFTSHAIVGTRHPPRPLSSPAAPTRAPPAPPTQTKSFSEHLAQSQRQRPPPPPLQPQSPLGFSSISYSATRPLPSGDPPSGSSAFPISIPSPLSKRHGHQSVPSPTSSPKRGTKRAMALIAGGPIDHEEPAETGARKFAKKLRKSASRVSADLSLVASHRSIRATSGSSWSSSSRPQTAATSSSFLTPYSSSASSEREPPPSRHSMTTRRSFASAWKNSGAGAGGNTSWRSRAAPNKLHKPRKADMAVGGRWRRGTSRSPGPASRPATPLRQPPSPLITVSRPVTPRDGEPEPMALDPPARHDYSPVFRPSPSGFYAEGVAVSNIRYPPRPRARGGPLSVVPDANRGIPTVPKIPAQFKDGEEVKAALSLRDSGVSAVTNMENYEVW